MARKNAKLKQSEQCPCGSGSDYTKCCAQYLGGQWPETAEQLMRSRYTAFTQNAEDYLLETWHEQTRPQSLNLCEQPVIKWTGLKVVSHSSTIDKAEVEFIARYKINGKAEKIHELSHFIKLDGRWFYVNGDNIH